MPKGSLFTLGWRPIGSSKRRWQLEYSVDAVEAARIAASLADSDGGGRWRVYDMVTVPAEGGSVKLVRRNVVAEGVVLPGCSGDPSARFRRGRRPVRSSPSSRRLRVGPVSVYRVRAAGADPSHVFGGEACDSDLTHAAWLGWLPLTLVDWAGPDIAVAGDTWLTGPPPGRSKSGPVAPGDVVTVDGAAGELLVRRECGLTVFTNRPADVPADGRLCASSVAVSVADDLTAQVAGLSRCPRGMGRVCRRPGLRGVAVGRRLPARSGRRFSGRPELRSGRAGAPGGAAPPPPAARGGGQDRGLRSCRGSRLNW